MNKYIYLISLAIFLPISEQNCDQLNEKFDTKTYHQKTSELKETIVVLDSLTQVVGNENCFEQKDADDLFIRYVDFCVRLQGLDLPQGKLISVKDCIVKEEVLDLKKYSKNPRVWKAFKEEAEELDSLMQVLLKDSKDFRSFLEKDCVRKYNLCQQIKKNEGNKAILQATKDLVAYKALEDDALYADSLAIKTKVQEFMQLPATKPGINPMYSDLLFALINDVKYRLSHRKNHQLCDDAHIRWAAIEKDLFHDNRPCEFLHFEEHSRTDGWLTILDNAWFQQEIEQSRTCAIYPRGCLCEDAINYNPKATQDNDICIGCMDDLALNYCPSARLQQNAPCYYTACDDRCFLEKPKNIHTLYPLFQEGRDSIVHEPSMCITNSCGCTNSCSENYDSAATIDDGSCIGEVCGCLDSLAVNYARRTEPDWAYLKYYNKKVTKSDSSLCIYTGCMSICALTYDPMAQIDDGNCKCDSTTRAQLEKLKSDLGLQLAGSVYSPEALDDEFKDYLTSKNAKRYSKVNFRRVDLDLFIDVEVQEMRIKSKGDYNGIPLGEYNFKPVNELIDALVSFLNFKTTDLLSSMLIVKIIGEADAHPIRSEGIDFKNAHRPITEKPFKHIKGRTATDVVSISQENYDLAPNAGPVSFSEGDKITDNIDLAFLRAYMVAQKIKDAEPSIDESRIFLGAKAHNVKGKKYRRVAISMLLSGFYETIATQDLVQSDAIEEINNAITFYEQHGGYPTSKKSYPQCPCIEGAFTMTLAE